LLLLLLQLLLLYLSLYKHYDTTTLPALLIVAARQGRSQCTAAGRALGVGLVLPPTRERDAGERKLERERGREKKEERSLLAAS
jgi:hypothetical protein